MKSNFLDRFAGVFSNAIEKEINTGGTESKDCLDVDSLLETDMDDFTSDEASIAQKTYSIKQLVSILGSDKDTNQLPPQLEQRVRDFRLAQDKRLQSSGQTSSWGIFGMYYHLSNVRIDLEWVEDAAWRRDHGEPYLSWADFDKARKKGMNRPWFTYFLIFICSVMLVVEFSLNDWKIAPLSENPLVGPSAEALITAGAKDTPLIVNDGQWFRLFSPLILHAGIIHYVINMLALYFIGGAIEQNHGVTKTIVLFLIPGFGGNILSAIFLPQYISVGASGGIFGLIGGCLADIMLNWKLMFIKTGKDDTQTLRRNAGAIIWLVLDIIVNIVIGLTPYVDNFTHLGGLFYGVCCGFSTIDVVPVAFFGVHDNACDKIRKFLTRFLGLIFSLCMIIVTTVWLATMVVGESSPCSACRYISCVPFPFWTEEKWWYCDDCDTASADLYKEEGGTFYDRIDLYCPNAATQTIDVSMEQFVDKNDVRQQLPSYCREFC